MPVSCRALTHDRSIKAILSRRDCYGQYRESCSYTLKKLTMLMAML